MALLRSLLIFIFAGLCEIGGGYLVWLNLKQGKPVWFCLLGFAILSLYGVVATWQDASFGRVYAAYGGIFIILSVFWGMAFDGFKPDARDIVGALIALAGAIVIVWPRAAIH